MEPRRPPPSQPTVPTAAPVPEDTSSVLPTAVGGGAPRVPSAREPRPGDVVGAYRIVSELGRGGMAVVFAAEEPALDRHVALKVLVPGGPDGDPQAVARFVREARAQAKVSNDHVVTIHAVGESGGAYFIAMPLLKGQTLADKLKRQPQLPVAEAVRIAAEIAEGLTAAHAVGLAHRDIKPSNVWLEVPRGWVKILDFGLAREHRAPDGQLTSAGTAIGTPAYMSPEQAAGKPVDPRTDLFSLGTVLYQMLTGEKPFTGDTGFNVMAAVLMNEPVPLRQLAPHAPADLVQLVARLMAKNPAHRPATAAQVATELGRIAKQLGAPVPVPVPPQPVPQPVEEPTGDVWGQIGSEATAPAEPAREEDEYEDAPAPSGKKWLLVAVGALAVVLLAVAAWAALGGKGKPEVVEKPKEQPAPPRPVPKVAPQPQPQQPDDRAAAEEFLKKATVTVTADGGAPVEVEQGGALPPGRLALTAIDFGNTKGLNALYVSNTLIPNITPLKSLVQLTTNLATVELSADQLVLLSNLPLAETIVLFDVQVEVTPAALPALRKFRALESAWLWVPDADDALLADLAKALPRMHRLTLEDVPAGNRVTDAGWQSVLRMPRLTAVTLMRCPSAVQGFRALTAVGGPNDRPLRMVEISSSPDFDDSHLRELAARGTKVKALSLLNVKITDAGLEHVAKLDTLQRFYTNRSKVTQEGIDKLRAARPALEINFNDKKLPPLKSQP